MNLGIIVPELRSFGVGGMVTEVIRRLPPEYNVHVFTKPSQFGVVPSNGAFHFAPTLGLLGLGADRGFGPLATLTVLRNKRRLGLDLVLSHTLTFLRDDLYFVHNCYRAMVEESLKYMNRSGRMLMQLSVPVKLRMTLEKWKIGGRNASGYIVPSLGLKQELEEFYNTPSEMITVLPNGINTERFHPKNRSRWADTVRRELGIPKGMRLAAFASHSYFGEGKGLRIILEAVALLGRQDVGVVVIGGDDPLSYKERAKRLGIGSQVFFVGHTGEIEKYYSVADVVVIASIYESFSLVAHEAAASGVPLVATAVHGVIDMFKAAIPGSLVERRPEAFACGIARLLDDAAFYRQASAEARRVAEQVSWDVVAPRFLEILKTYWR